MVQFLQHHERLPHNLAPTVGLSQECSGVGAVSSSATSRNSNRKGGRLRRNHRATTVRGPVGRASEIALWLRQHLVNEVQVVLEFGAISLHRYRLAAGTRVNRRPAHIAGTCIGWRSRVALPPRWHRPAMKSARLVVPGTFSAVAWLNANSGLVGRAGRARPDPAAHPRRHESRQGERALA
jgi:hypothetical protein